MSPRRGPAPRCRSRRPPAGLSKRATALVLGSLLLLGPTPDAAAQPAPRADVSRLDYRLQARHLGQGVHVVEGDNDDFSVANGCNIINTGFIVADEGVLVINTGPSRRYGEQLRALIARTTPRPVLQVVHLNLHPDYFLGNQAFADVPRLATAATREGIARESASYETNLYRLCGDWMKGTETLPPDRVLDVSAGRGQLAIGSRVVEWHLFRGHTASDLVLVDRSSGVAFAGGLVFHQRVPTTPHAELPAWMNSLQAFEQIGASQVVPSHGPVHSGTAGAAATLRFLRWLDESFARHAERGLEMNEVLRAPVPAEFTGWAAFRTEFVRNVAHLYPRYEAQALGTPRR